MTKNRFLFIIVRTMKTMFNNEKICLVFFINRSNAKKKNYVPIRKLKYPHNKIIS